MQRPCIENEEGGWTRVRTWKEGCGSPSSHRPTAKKETLRTSHSPEATGVCFSFTGQMCEDLQVACIPTACEEQTLAQSYQERCATMSGPKAPLCAMNLPFSRPLQTKKHCAPDHPFPTVMTPSADQQSGLAEKWEIYSEDCQFFLVPFLFPAKVCSPVRCQVDGFKSQMCHA